MWTGLVGRTRVQARLNDQNGDSYLEKMRESREIGSDSKDSLSLLGLEVGNALFVGNMVVVIKDLKITNVWLERDT